MYLTGSNVTVVVADSGIDTNHPAFTTGGSLGAPGAAPIRVQGYTTNDFVDTDGHGTFVAGQIAGNGDMSTSPVNVGGVLQSLQLRVGDATRISAARRRWRTLLCDEHELPTRYLQEAAAQVTNALIANNSWNYDGDNTYNLAAASYDAATRDALSGVTGSQPMLFVFSAGNAGDGDDDANDPGDGTADTIQSPATAKNVITVGAMRGIAQHHQPTSRHGADGTPGAVWLAETNASSRVAGFSSRGNVGIGIEGEYWAVQAGRGCAGNIRRLHALHRMGHQHVFLPEPDESPTSALLRRHRRSGFAVGQRISHRSQQRHQREHHGDRRTAIRRTRSRRTADLFRFDGRAISRLGVHHEQPGQHSAGRRVGHRRHFEQRDIISASTTASATSPASRSASM